MEEKQKWEVNWSLSVGMYVAKGNNSMTQMIVVVSCVGCYDSPRTFTAEFDDSLSKDPVVM